MNSFSRISARAALLSSLAIAANAQEFVALSRTSAGATGDFDSGAATVSADGRRVAFESAARNLIGFEASFDSDVYVADLWEDGLVRVSVSPSGAEGNSDSYRARISDDGQFVAYLSTATNLVANQTGALPQAIVCDLASATNTLASVSLAGGPASGAVDWADVSDGGRFVVFVTDAANVAPGDTNFNADVFVRDMLAGVTTRVSVDSNGQQASWPNGPFSVTTALTPVITPDGRYVAFATIFALDPGDSNSTFDVYVHDRTTGSVALVSLATGGAQTNDGSYRPDLSADGRWISFASDATNLVAGDTNGQSDFFLRDRNVSTTVCLSRALSGLPAGIGQAGAFRASVSSDGSHIAFASTSNEITTNDTNALADVFVFEVATGAVQRMLANGVDANAASIAPAISSGGATVAFTSAASNFVAGDTNGRSDVFAWRRDRCAPQRYCVSGISANGCVPALSGVGVASLSNCTLTLALTGVDGQRQGLIFYSVSGAQALPWGTSSSLFCVKSPTQRTALQSTGGSSVACDGQLGLSWCAYLASQPGALGAPFTEGDAVYAQAWYRDPAGLKTTAFSNAVRFEFCP